MEETVHLDMAGFGILAAGILLIPLCYAGLMALARDCAFSDENRKRRLFSVLPEYLAAGLAEAAFLVLWGRRNGLSWMEFACLAAILPAMAAFCITDLWERIVPNRLLLLMLFCYLMILGVQGIREIEIVEQALPGIVLGTVFCGITFGLGYLLSHGNMGAGDVKLALLLGLYLTGDYVVDTILYGCVAAAVYSLIQIGRKRLTRKDAIPFVPFLYLGMILSYLRHFWQ